MDLFFEKLKNLGLGLRVTAKAIIPHLWDSYTAFLVSQKET